MEKIIVICPKCKKKMKINNKRAKYRCPNCQEIYKFGIFRKVVATIKGVITGFFDTIRDIKNGIVKKYRDTVATYKYMKQLRAHMKNDPNWSNYRRQQQEEKDVTPKKSRWNFFKKK